MVHTSSRNKKPIDRLVDKTTADWKPSKHTTVKRVMSDNNRSSENQEEAWHFLEKTAERDFHPEAHVCPKVCAHVAKTLPPPGKPRGDPRAMTNVERCTVHGVLYRGSGNY